MASHVGTDAGGQVRRAAGRFALVAAAGELAAGCGILPWQPGEAERAAAACFKAWRAARPGGDGTAEDAAPVAAVRTFIALHGESRFQPLGDNDEAGDARPVINRAGYLVPSGEKDGRLQKSERVGLPKKVRVYCVRASILSGEAEE